MSPTQITQADAERFVEIENELPESKVKEDEESSSGDEEEEKNKNKKRNGLEEEEEEDNNSNSSINNGDSSNPLDWHPQFTALNIPKREPTPRSSHPNVTKSSPLGVQHIKTINSISFEEYREVQHSLDKANEQISLLKARLSSNSRRVTLEKDKLERAQLTAKIESLKVKIEELNYQILYGNSQKDKEIQSLKTEVAHLRISETRARIQSTTSGTGEKGSFNLNASFLSPAASTTTPPSPSPSPSPSSQGSTPSPSPSSDDPIHHFSPSLNSPFTMENQNNDLSRHQPPLLLEFDKKDKRHKKGGKNIKELEYLLKGSQEIIDDYKEKILHVEAAYLKEKELRATERETLSQLLQEKESELRNIQAKERTLAGIQPYLEIRRFCGLLFCCMNLDVEG